MNRPQVDPAVTHPDVYFHMIRPNLDEIPHFPLPPGYRLRTYAPGDEAHWTALHYAAEPIIEVTDELFEEQYGDNRAALPERMFFVETDDGDVVGSASAWWETRDFDNPANRGRVHWVVVHPDHQRRGLTKPMMTQLLTCMARHHTAAMLGTSSSRPWAIKVYLECGFAPDPAELTQPEFRAAWQSVQAILQHPVLAACLPSSTPESQAA